MQNKETMMFARRTNRKWLGWAAMAAVVALCAPAHALVRDDDDVDASFPKIAASTLAPIKLPEGARRALKQDDLDKFEVALQKVAEAAKGKIGKFEVLVWPGKDAMKTLPDQMKQAGYSYTTQAAFDSDAGRITPVAAVARDPKEKREDLLGMWIEKDGFSLLVWGHYKADSAARPASEKTAASEAAGKSVAGVPGDLIGSWSWTTIGGVNYVDKVTGRLSAPSGMSAKFTFTKDGRYKKFFYVRQQTYSLVTVSETNEEGAVAFNNDGTMTLKPTKGHYNGNTGSRVIDRDMTESERKPATWYWEWKNVDGKRQLHLGPTRDALKPFKPAE